MNISLIKLLLATPHPVSGAWDEDNALAAAQFNTKDIERIKGSMSGDEIFAATDASEFNGLTEHRQQIWLAFCGRSDIDPAGSANVAIVNWIFGESSTTLSSLGSARTELISFATQKGLGFVSPTHITDARAYHG